MPLFTQHRTTRALSAGLLALAAVPAGLVATSSPAGALPTGSSWVVSLGDSYISGEAGRWAGNSSDQSQVDALGDSAYWDAGTSEAITGCHRSKTAEIIVATVSSANLACSGAKAATSPYSSGNDFKPGLDFYNDGAGHIGQALALKNFASTHLVKMVQLSIGGNDFNFASIVSQCVTDFLYSPTWWKDYCKDDSSVTSNFTSANITAVRGRIAAALSNVNSAMSQAGYTTSDYSIVLQTYPSPLPRGSGIRYGESGYTRQNTGGCGFWNADADWANDYALPTINSTVKAAATQSGLPNVKIMDVASLLNGRRLCENTVNRLQDLGSSFTWQSAGAVDRSEWVSGIRTVTAAGSDYYVQESFHPNYWGELALRNCVRQSWNNGTPKGGTCVRGANGLNSRGEPNTTLG